MEAEISSKQRVVFSAEDKIFAAFCAKIGVENIRDYEDNQLKRAKETSEKQLELSSRLSKLTNE